MQFCKLEVFFGILVCFNCIIKTFCKVEYCLKMSNHRHKSIKIKCKAKMNKIVKKGTKQLKMKEKVAKKRMKIGKEKDKDKKDKYTIKNYGGDI